MCDLSNRYEDCSGTARGHDGALYVTAIENTLSDHMNSTSRMKERQNVGRIPCCKTYASSGQYPRTVERRATSKPTKRSPRVRQVFSSFEPSWLYSKGFLDEDQELHRYRLPRLQACTGCRWISRAEVLVQLNRAGRNCGSYVDGSSLGSCGRDGVAVDYLLPLRRSS